MRLLIVIHLILGITVLAGCGVMQSSIGGLSSVPAIESEKVALTLPPLQLVEGGSLLVALGTSSELEQTASLSWVITGTNAASTFTAVSGTVNLVGTSGSFSIVSIDDAIVNGTRSFTLQMTLTGSAMSLAGSSFVIEITDNDTAPTITLAALSTVTSANVATYSMSGTCSVNAQAVNVAVSDGVLSVSPSPQPTCLAGVWSIANFDLSSLAEGNLSVTVDHSDGAGNNAVQIVRAVFKDTLPPSVPSLVLDGASKASLADSPVITFTGALQADLDHYEIQVKRLSDSVVIEAWQSFVSGNVVSGLTLASEVSYFVEVRSVDTYGNVSAAGTSDGWLADTTGPTAPTGLALGYASLKLDRTGPIALTSIGTDGGVGVQKNQLRLVTAANVVVKDWVDNALNTSYKEDAWFGFTGLAALAVGDTYKLQTRSVDSLGNLGTVAELSFTAKQCPTNYVPIYPLSTRPSGNVPTYPYPTDSFCVAKFEMKAVDGANALVNGGNGNIAYSATYHAASRPDGTPWVKMTQVRSVNRCADIGQTLITNGQWQTISRHMLVTNENWSSGTALTGYMNSGNYAGFSATAIAPDGLAFAGTVKTLAASSASVAFSDANGYAGILTPTLFAGKRTHTLPWGDIVWDMGANAIEFVRDISLANQWITQAADVPVTSLTGVMQDRFGFTESVAGCIDIDNAVDAWDQIGNACLAGWTMFPAASDAWDISILRGSHYANGADNGLFKADGNDGTTDVVNYGGFRCVIENP